MVEFLFYMEGAFVRFKQELPKIVLISKRTHNPNTSRTAEQMSRDTYDLVGHGF